MIKPDRCELMFRGMFGLITFSIEWISSQVLSVAVGRKQITVTTSVPEEMQFLLKPPVKLPANLLLSFVQNNSLLE